MRQVIVAEGADTAKRGRGARRARRAWLVARRCLAVAAVLALAAATAALAVLGDTARAYLGMDATVQVSAEDADATMAAGRALAERVEGEGLVLLRNEDGALPLPADVTRVNVFGWASTAWVASGSGSGQVAGQTMGLLDALEERGVSYNTELTDMYRSVQDGRPFDDAGSLNCDDTEFCRLCEPSVDDSGLYTPELLEHARAFSDTAIVVIGRRAGESVDCPRAQYRVLDGSGEVHVDATRGYLELSREEEALLAYVGATYEHVVVVVNSTNAMELGELETTPGIDAALLVGATGEVGARSVVDALWGDVNPSGRTTDTYAYDLATSPAWAHAGVAGEGSYTNGAGLYPADGTQNVNVGTPEPYDAVRYVDYAEGIYVGYRWYETADAEGFWDDVSNEHGQGYDGVVQYPFGYGLSYTDFSWEVTGGSLTEGVRPERDTPLSLTVRVTNTGAAAGRDVVELYCLPPYEPGGIEKSAEVLVAYGKTGLLRPGESEDVTLSFTLDDVASYDCYDANGNGFRGYELEAGDYVVRLMRDAHTPAACAGAEATVRLPRDVRCETDLVTGAVVTNRFTGDDAVDGVSVDGSDDGAGGEGSGVTYLTRADFAASFPARRGRNRAMSDEVAALNLYDASQAETGDGDAGADAAAGAQPEVSRTGAGWELVRSGELTALGRSLGSDYDSALWEILLNRLSVRDMSRLVLHGYLATGAVDALGKPLTKEVDGPAQVGSFNQLSYGVGYPCATVLAQTWDAGLAREYGRQLGLEAAVLGVDGLYAPCADLHRTPAGGRNYEYFSEDPLICGTMAAQVAGGAADAGTHCYLKHLAVYTQESYRDSLYVWLTEQSLRELYLRPFRIAVRDGATGVMTSYNRLGAVWAGGSRALLTDVLRGEWGFEGAVITDYADHQQYMSADQALAAGGDLYMDGVFRDGSFASGFDQGAPAASEGSEELARYAAFVADLRRATKNVLYAWLSARVSNLAYNEAAAEAGAEPIERPLKVESPDYLGCALALADAVALMGTVVWVHGAIEHRRAALLARRAKQ
ncbi:glycoside hydrolase family 3 N-terminal domain-containing protein [Thermophilibacter sp.]